MGYVVWCDEAGQVIDDGTVFHIRENEYWLLCVERQLDNLGNSAVGFDVKIEEITMTLLAWEFRDRPLAASSKPLDSKALRT